MCGFKLKYIFNILRIVFVLVNTKTNEVAVKKSELKVELKSNYMYSQSSIVDWLLLKTNIFISIFIFVFVVLQF